MFEWFHDHPLTVRIIQAAIVSGVALAVADYGRRQGIMLLGQTAIAILRGLVQIIAVGLVLVFILPKPPIISLPVLVLMILTAAIIAGRRSRNAPGAYQAALYGISLGSASIIALMSLVGAIKFSVEEIVPIGSMLIANTMNTAAQALERFRSDVASHVGPIEAALALGADPATTVRPYVRAAAESAMIPRVDNLASLGIVWIPGLMAGMLVQHGNPIEAAIYNFSVIAMIYASSGIAATATLSMVRHRAFTPAGQLLIRPAEAKANPHSPSAYRKLAPTKSR
ncbi:MAG TPA: ABC transporter permease [Phycisphaerae bacterium]|nr:ABC transporter permease [Phycisphaerae bacterium]